MSKTKSEITRLELELQAIKEAESQEILAIKSKIKSEKSRIQEDAAEKEIKDNYTKSKEALERAEGVFKELNKNLVSKMQETGKARKAKAKNIHELQNEEDLLQKSINEIEVTKERLAKIQDEHKKTFQDLEEKKRADRASELKQEKLIITKEKLLIEERYFPLKEELMQQLESAKQRLMAEERDIIASRQEASSRERDPLSVLRERLKGEVKPNKIVHSAFDSLSYDSPEERGEAVLSLLHDIHDAILLKIVEGKKRKNEQYVKMEIIKTLFSMGLRIKNDTGEGVFYAAFIEGMYEAEEVHILNKLLQAGANINKQDTRGLLPLDLVLKRLNQSVVALEKVREADDLSSPFMELSVKFICGSEKEDFAKTKQVLQKIIKKFIVSGARIIMDINEQDYHDDVKKIVMQYQAEAIAESGKDANGTSSSTGNGSNDEIVASSESGVHSDSNRSVSAVSTESFAAQEEKPMVLDVPESFESQFQRQLEHNQDYNDTRASQDEVSKIGQEDYYPVHIIIMPEEAPNKDEAVTRSLFASFFNVESGELDLGGVLPGTPMAGF